MHNMEVKEVKVQSFGEQLVGLDFNPSGNEKVQKAKELCAELANLLKDSYTESERTPVKSLLFDHAVGEILNAQMTVVKVITLK
jgi:hypothetical protein